MIEIPNNILFEEIEHLIKGGDTVKLKLVGNSMYPFLRNGRDSVVLSPFHKDDLKRGSVALFKYKNTYVLHRIITVNDGVYTFRGDGNIKLTERVYIDDIVALMIGVEYASGQKCVCNSFWWRSSSFLWLALYPFRRYLLWICRRVEYVRGGWCLWYCCRDKSHRTD